MTRVTQGPRPEDEYPLEGAPLDPTNEFSRLGIEVGSLVVHRGGVYYVDGFSFDKWGREVAALSIYGTGTDGRIFALDGEVDPVIVSSNTAFAAPTIEGSIPGANGGHWLYYFHDMRGDLLYVGISEDALSRWRQHERDKEWFGDVVSFKRVWYATREAVLAAEKWEIKRLNPAYNIAHSERKCRTL